MNAALRQPRRILNPPVRISIHGRIVSNWRRTADRFELETTIPANTTATVYLPATNAEKVIESGKALGQSRGWKLLRTENH